MYPTYTYTHPQANHTHLYHSVPLQEEMQDIKRFHLTKHLKDFSPSRELRSRQTFLRREIHTSYFWHCTPLIQTLEIKLEDIFFDICERARSLTVV